MKKYWKQFEALVTASKADLFASARLRLTIFYLAILTVVLIVFSLILYVSFSYVLKENIDTEFPDAQDQGDQAILQTMGDAKAGVVIIDSAALIITGILSFSLAGKTLKPIKKALAKQKEFSANASHELRTPLAIMKTDSEVVLQNPNSTKVEMKAALESNLEEINRMTQMVENLLKLSRLESKSVMFSDKVDISEIISSIAKRMMSLAKDKGVEIKINKASQAKILGNREYLELMVFNILQNAINYGKRGGEVKINDEIIGDSVNISVQDSGPGIAAEDLPRVFERFYKGDKNRTENSSGTGVGLSIVKEIVEKHEGSIKIQSALGKGTKVIIKLPKIGSLNSS